jgi:hypothetical protein
MGILRSWSKGTKRSFAMMLGIGAVMLSTQPVVRTFAIDPPVTPLPFSKGFLVTGGYAVGSVDFTSGTASGGFVTGTINMSGVPANADIVAAYLYWQTIATDVSQVSYPKFRDQPILVAKESSKVLNASAAPCWSGGTSNATYTMYGFRADVLRMLPSMSDATGIHVLVNNSDLQANGQALSTITLPDSGAGNHIPLTPGATLFVVYRDRVSPLTSISVYDNDLLIQAPGATTTETFTGFLGAPANPTARVTHVVSSGSNNSTERVFFNGTQLTNPFNPFSLQGGSSSERGWNTVTYDVGNLMGAKVDSPDYGERVTTTIDHTSTSPYECLSWSAMIFSTTVRDADQDGLPDRLEEQSGLKSPDGKLLPDLHGMLASPLHKDIFIEMGALQDSAGLYDATHHNHLPTPAVLKLVGDAYRNAPVNNPGDGTTGIFPHFDVGSSAAYFALGPAYASGVANQYLVPDGLARGGELIQEADEPTGQFAGYPGTVSWKIGYQVLRDAPENQDGTEMSAAAETACNDATLDCRRRFDQNRMNFFHYVLYTHYRAKPQDPCITGSAADQAACKLTAPYHTPSSASGIADVGGADAMVSLGAWGHGFLGSDFIRASTTLHELGHTTWLTHGGSSVSINEPNCKPNYLSVMNYLFQMGGLRDEDGTPHLDYSSAASGVINENALTGDPLNPIHLQYRTGWYAPKLPGTLPYLLDTPVAARYCNGGKFPWTGTPPAGWVDYARVDAYSATLQGIDWSAGLGTNSPQDVNYDGQQETALNGYNDWANLRLDQVGARRNMAGFSSGIDLEFGVDVSGGDDLWGVDVSGGVDWDGVDYFGVDVSGGIDFGPDTIDYSFGVDVSGGVDDLAFGVDVSGGGDQFGVDVSGGNELDVLISKALGNAPPNNVKACVLDTAGCATTPAGGLKHRVKIVWEEPNVGVVDHYAVYRFYGNTVTPSSMKVTVNANVPGNVLSTIDQEELPDTKPFTYFVIAFFQGGGKSNPSNFSTIYAKNDAPVAVADPNFTTAQETPMTGSVAPNDTDTDSPTSLFRFEVVTGPAHAQSFSFNQNTGSFSYTPAKGFYNAADTFTYRVNDGTWNGPPNGIAMSGYSNTVTVTIAVTKGKK